VFALPSPRAVLKSPHVRALVFVRLCAIVLLFPADVARAQTVPLVNPGFEAGFTGWTYYTKKKANAIQLSSDAHTGVSSMELRDKDAWIVQESAHVLAAGDDVVLRFWVKDPGKEKEDDANWNAALVWLDSTGTVQTITSIQAWRAKTWEERMLAFTVPVGDNSVGRRLAVFFGAGKKRILLDDVVLEVNNRTCFGFPAEYAGSLKNLKKRVYAVPVVMTEPGTLHSIAAYTQGKEKEKIRYAVYADAAGAPGARLAETVADPLGTKNWHWHTIPAPEVILMPGT